MVRWKFWILVGLLIGVAAHIAVGLAYMIYSQPVASGENFVSNFEVGNLSEWGQLGARQLCCKHSAQATTAYARNGRWSVRMEQSPDDPLVRGGARAEFRLKSVPWETDYIYQVSFYLPADWEADYAPVTILQWHNVPDRLLLESGSVPPLRLEVIGSEYRVVSHWDRRRISRFPWQPFNTEGSATIVKSPIDRGRWTDWRFRVRWSLEEDGLIEVWKDGEMIGLRRGPNAFRDQYTPYFKVGVYVAGVADVDRPVVPARVLFADDIAQFENSLTR